MKRIAGGLVLLLGVSVLSAASVNAPAPNFQKLTEYRGKIVLVNFWASWCAPCQQELPELNRLAAEYAGKNVRVLAINVDEKRGNAQDALKRLKLSKPSLEIIWDTTQKIVTAYDIPTMPSSFIVDTHGIVRVVHAGYHSQDPALWRKEISKLH